MPKETTSRETMETKSYGKKLLFMVKFPEVLGSTMHNVWTHRHTSDIANTYMLHALAYFSLPSAEKIM
jgi:hypothetical protein